ncbi:MAG: hypothetical protein HGA90_01870 [Alphaproteobacteria bacterium]|nr:hypothetical protein [Alphaproteobacteria bacterium]
MVALYFLGNCQVNTFEFLAENMVSGAAVASQDITRDGLRDLLEQGMAAADYVFVQRGFFSPEELAEVKRAFAGKVVTLANFYFRGLHPDVCYVGSTKARQKDPSFYHSLAVLDAYLRGRSEKEAVRALSYENFQRLGVLEAWDSSLDEMRRRDADVDFPAAALIDQYCHELPGFLTVNHPAAGLLYRYWTAVLKAIGLSFRPMNTDVFRDPLEGHDVFPLFDFVAEHYALPYRTTQQWLLNHPGRRFANAEEYVRLFYSAYNKASLDQLWVHSPLDMIERLKSTPTLNHLVQR